MKVVKIVLSPEADKTLQLLESSAKKRKQERTLVNGFYKKIEMVKYDIYYGNSIEKDRIPLEYKIKYNANNLFRVEIPGFWRFIYTLKNGQTDDEIVVLILDIIDHDLYNKKFGYKGH